MIKFNKKAIILLLTFVMMISMVFQVSYAVDNAGDMENRKVKLICSEADKDGYVTLSLVAYNATFAAGQFGFSFDNSVLQFVDKNTKELSNNFDDVAVAYEFNNGETSHKFTQATKINTISNDEGKFRVGFYSLPTPETGKDILINVDDKGFKIYDFTAKLLKNEDPKFEVLDYISKVFVKEAFLSDGQGDKALTLEVVLPERLGGSKGEIVYAPKAPEKTLKQKRAERLVDSLILNIGNYAAVDDGFLKWVDDSNKEVIPFIDSDRTFVPVRFISEAFGAEVNWNPENQEIVIKLKETEIKMYIGNIKYTVNGAEKEMDAVPLIKQDRTFVPIRFISEALGKSVYWEPGMKLIIVTPEERPWDPNGEAEKNILPDALLIMSDLIRDLKPTVPEK